MRVLLSLLALLLLTGCEPPDPKDISAGMLVRHLHETFGIDHPIPTFFDRECLPEADRHRPHDDWFWPISMIPRYWTAVCGDEWPQFPELLAGNSGWTLADKPILTHHTDEFIEAYGDRLPIPKPGHWVFSAVMYDYVPLFYFGITFKNDGKSTEYEHFRIGVMRWDDVDNFWELFELAQHAITVPEY